MSLKSGASVFEVIGVGLDGRAGVLKVIGVSMNGVARRFYVFCVFLGEVGPKFLVGKHGLLFGDFFGLGAARGVEGDFELADEEVEAGEFGGGGRR